MLAKLLARCRGVLMILRCLAFGIHVFFVCLGIEHKYACSARYNGNYERQRKERTHENCSQSSCSLSSLCGLNARNCIRFFCYVFSSHFVCHESLHEFHKFYRMQDKYSDAFIALGFSDNFVERWTHSLNVRSERRFCRIIKNFQMNLEHI